MIGSGVPSSSRTLSADDQFGGRGEAGIRVRLSAPGDDAVERLGD